MTQKVNFVMAVQKADTLLAKLAPEFRALFEAYFDRKYDQGGENELTDEDIPPELEVTAGDIRAFMTLAENMGKLLNNEAPFVSDYWLTINKLRTDI